MLLLRRARPAAAPEPRDQVELSHTPVPLTGAMARAWRVHARRELAWWLRRQERAEIRTALAAAGLL